MQESLTNKVLRNQCPVDLHFLRPVRAHTEAEVVATVQRARQAQKVWAALSFEERSRRMKRAGKRMLERRQEVLELIHDEAGKTPGELLMSEAVGPLQYISDWTKVARPWLKPKKLPISFLAFPRKKGVIEMLPRGVVGIISPWNYPLANFFKPVFAALLCGNAVVIKPSEFSPLTAEWFVKRMEEFLPSGVLTLAQGDRQIGRALVQSGIDAVTFTGSFQSGREVAKLAAEQMIPCSVELGGKDAALVFADCDLDRTVAGVMHWALHNAGQACGDIERVYLEEGPNGSFADKFIAQLARAVSALRVHSGDPQHSDVGPTVHSAQLKIIEEHVADAVSKGAKIVCGGKRTGKGLWFEPTVLDHCTQSMKVMQEPTFGPIIPIVRVKDANEAIRLSNDCGYGLNASVWSGNERKATQIARELEVGTAFVNNHAFTGAIPAAPWTGVKKTGYGIANSVFGLQHYTRPRTLVVDRKKTADGWWLPMDANAEDLGQRLALAQIGKLLAAVKIPFLMNRRERTVIDYVRNPQHVSDKVSHLKSARTVSGPRFWGRLFRPFLTKLSDRELRIAQAAMAAIYSVGPNPAPQAALFPPLSQKESAEFILDLYRSMPFPANLGLRATFWVIGFSPVLYLRRFTFFDRLSAEDQFSILKRIDGSRNYMVQQISLLIKMNGSLSHVSTSRFAGVMAGAQKSQLSQADRESAEKNRSDQTFSKLEV